MDASTPPEAGLRRVVIDPVTLQLATMAFLIALREIDEDLRLKAGMNIFWQFKRGSIVVHRGDEAKIRMGLDLDSGHNRLHIAPAIEQRSQTCPTLLAHSVPFVQNDDAPPNHCRD